MTIKADKFEGFNVGQLMDYLKKLPKKTKIVLNMGNDGEEPLNVIQEPHETMGSNIIMFNSFYKEEF